MVKIDKLEIKNFKFFDEVEALEFDSKNILIYGENGSGKSSIFKAFELLRYSAKSDVSQEFDENRNIFNLDNESFIKFTFDNEIEIKIDSNYKNKNYSFIENFYLINSILDYKKLLHINFTTNLEYKKINIFPMLDKLFAYYPIDIEKAIFLKDIENPNEKLEELKKILNGLIGDINIFLTKFTTEFSIKRFVYTTDYIPLTKKLGFNNILEFVINIEIDFIDKKIERYHIFLNEARLSSLAISIYFAIIKYLSNRVQGDILKLLVLDDLLISLDMSNRNMLLDIFLNDEVLKEYQKIILTHDKNFFEMAKQKFNYKQKDKWKYFEMYVNNKGEFEKPFIMPQRDYFEKAEYFFLKYDYSACANYLRKEAERLLKSLVCHHIDLSCEETKNLQLLIDRVKNRGSLREKENIVERVRELIKFNEFDNLINLDLTQLPTIESKRTIGTIRTELKRFKEFSDKEIEGLNDTLIMLEEFKSLILNPQSHDDTKVALYKKELEDAIKVIKKLRRDII